MSNNYHEEDRYRYDSIYKSYPDDIKDDEFTAFRILIFFFEIYDYNRPFVDIKDWNPRHKLVIENLVNKGYLEKTKHKYKISFVGIEVVRQMAEDFNYNIERP